MYGLRGSLSALRETRFEDVLEGKTTMERYLLSRFEQLERAPAVADEKPQRGRIKRLAKRIIPPIAVHAVRWLARNRHHGERVVAGLLPPFVCESLRRWVRNPAHAPAHAAPSAQTCAFRENGQSVERQREIYLRDALYRLDAVREADLSNLFLRDLDRMLCLVDVRPDDHVLLPIAHGREAYAIRRLIDEIGEVRSPMFHLVFRHPIATLDELEAGRAISGPIWYTRLNQTFFDVCRAFLDTTRMRYYAGTDELAFNYGHLAGAEFHVLPIRLRADLIPVHAEHGETRRPLKMLYLGDVRAQYDLQLLAGLVRAIFDDYLKTGKLKLIVDAGASQEHVSGILRQEFEGLPRCGVGHVEVIGRSDSPATGEYHDLVASSDVMLCPDQDSTAWTRNTGVLAEAILAGKPTIVKGVTWLAGQPWRGSSETFTDLASLVAAVRTICERYEEHTAGALSAQHDSQHDTSPDHLMNCLLGRSKMSRANAA